MGDSLSHLRCQLPLGGSLLTKGESFRPKEKPPSQREVDASKASRRRELVAEPRKAGIDEKGTDAGIFWVTPSVTFGASSLWEGAF